MGYGGHETKLIQEQSQHIQALEDQLDVCRGQVKAQEPLIEKQNQTLALLAGALLEKGKD